MRNSKPKQENLPIIDLNEIRHGEAMVKACLDHGFFYIDNRCGQVIDIKVVDELQRKSKEFFQSPADSKRKFAIENSMSLTGYVGVESVTNFVQHLNEIFVVHSPFLYPSMQDEINSKSQFEPTLTQYTMACWKLNEKIYTWLAPFLDLKNVRKSNIFLKSWDEGFQERLWTGRLLHYPPKGGAIAPHNDVGLLTILTQDQTGGLQVWFQEQWVDVPPIENTFIVNIGEILQNWSSGLLKSTRHRVINKRAVDRYSITFLPLLDKTCEVYIPEDNGWKYPFNHLTERYYSIYKHLAEKVQNPINFLNGKTPKEIDEFHKKAFLASANN